MADRDRADTVIPPPARFFGDEQSMEFVDSNGNTVGGDETDDDAGDGDTED